LLFHFRLNHLELKLATLFNSQILVRSVFTYLRNKLRILFCGRNNTTSPNRTRFVVIFSLHCFNVEKSGGLFKTFILIHWFRSPKRNKNIRRTVRWLGQLSSCKHTLRLLNFTVLHLWTTIFRFHRANYLLFASIFGYGRAVITWIVISACFHVGHLIIINCLRWLTFIFIRRTWLAPAFSSLFIMISWIWKIWSLGIFSLLCTWRNSTFLAMFRRGSRYFNLIKLLSTTCIWT